MELKTLVNTYREKFEEIYRLWDKIDYYRVFGYEEGALMELTVKHQKVRNNMETWKQENLENKTYHQLFKMYQRYRQYTTKADAIKKNVMVGKKNMVEKYSTYSADENVRNRLETWLNMIAKQMEKMRIQEEEEMRAKQNQQFKL